MGLLSAQRSPDSFIIQEEPVQVLLMGTFHFAYPGQDEHKTSEDKKLDILSEQRQAELQELLDYVARFKPTHIVVESGKNTGYLMNRMRRWQAEEEELHRNERDQVGIRLAERLGLDTLYGCDAGSLSGTMQQEKWAEEFQPFLEEIYAESNEPQTKDGIGERYFEWYDYQDEYKLDHTLLEVFQYMNREENIRRMHGHYLVGDFKRGDTEGADGLALYWYSRNLRIFRKIQQIGAEPGDRILVLFGAGHIELLRQQFAASPEYKLVPFSALTNKG